MAITWGSASGHLRVGIDISQSPSTVSSSTTSVKWTVTYYVETVAWEMYDNQTLTLSGNITGTYNYYMSSGPQRTVRMKIATRTISRSISHSSGASISVSARVSGMYNGGTPSHSRSASVGPRPASIPSAPGTPSVSNITDTTARVTFSAPSSNGGRAISEYQIMYSRYSDYRTFEQMRGQTSRTFNISGLSRGHTWYVRARAYNGGSPGGWGPWSGSRSFTTHNIPKQVGRPSISNVGQTGATASWSAPSNGGSAITGYDVQIARNSSFSTGLQTFSTTSRSRTFTGLATDVTFYVRVRAKNVYGAGSWSTVASFSTFWETFENYPTPTPTISRIGGTSQSTGEPLIVVDIRELHPKSGGTRNITYQISQSSSFPSGSTISETIDFRAKTEHNRTNQPRYSWASGDTTKMGIYLPANQPGTWYIRVRTGGSANLKLSSWASTSINVSHTPSATVVSPTGGTYLRWAPDVFEASFQVNDSWNNDRISAYQVVIENSSTGDTIYNSGKVAVNLPLGRVNVNLAVGSALLNVAARWRVRVWDSTDTVSPYSPYASFTSVTDPVVEIIKPEADEELTTGRPEFEWAVDLTMGRTVASSRIEVFSPDASAPTWTHTVNSSTLNYTPPRPIVSNEIIYTVVITVTDNRGLTASAASNFSTSFIAPDPVSYNINDDMINEQGFIEVDWIDSDIDEDQIAWRVYRQELPTGDWEQIAEITDFSIRSYHDYMLKSGRIYMYTVTQVADRFGDALESPVGSRRVVETGLIEAESRTYQPLIDKYWLITPEYPDFTMPLDGVTGDSNTLEYETEVFGLIGRGRHVDYGDRLGYAGQLVLSVRQPERTSELRFKVETLRDLRRTYWVRSPFGKLFPVALGNLQWEPLQGTGTMEMGDLTLEYWEVGN